MQVLQAQDLEEPLDIVVIDDNADDLKWITRLAMDLQHHCNMHPVQDSQTLESALLDHNPSIVFVDHNLGEDNGIELIKQFHKHFPDVAFVLITNMGTEEIMLNAIRAGASDYIEKDKFTAEEVDNLIKRVLKNIYRHSYARMAITLLNEGIVTTDSMRRIVRCNPAFELMVDKDESELIGTRIEDLILPADEEVIRTLFSLSDSMWKSSPRVRLQSESEIEKTVEVSVNSLIAARNKNYLVIFKEVYQENQSLNSVDKQLAIIDASPDFIGYANQDGEIQFLNPAAKRFLGIEELDDKHRLTLFELFSPVMRRSFATHIFSTLAKQGQFVGNGLVEGKYRKGLPVSIVMNGLMGPDGSLTTITFILREIAHPSH